MHTTMNLELLKFVNSDLTWNAVKKGRRSMTRRPRRPGASSSGNKIQDTLVYDYEKSGVAILGQRFADEVLDVPIKKRILMLQSPQPQTLHLEEGPNLNDFSGIELLASAACHSSVFDNSVHIESSEVEDHTMPKVDADTDGIKEVITLMESDDSSVQDNTFPVTQNICDNGNGEGDKSPVPTKVARLHWDLNTLMDEWEEPRDILVDSQSEKNNLKVTCNETRNNQITEDEKGSPLHDAVISVVPLSKPEIFGIQGNNDGVITSKTYDVDSGMSKSDVSDSFVHPAKCETVSTSTTSVSVEQTTIKVESLNKSDDGQAVSEVVQGGCVSLKGDNDNKITSEDRLSDCRASNVSQDELAEGNTIDNSKAGYDSPVEDGELREPTRYHPWEIEEVEETECVDYESDNMYEDNFDSIETVQLEIPLDDNKTIGASGVETVNGIQQCDKVDTLSSIDSPYDNSEKKDDSSAKFHVERRSGWNLDRSASTSFGVHKNSAFIRRGRSDNIQDSYSRDERDFGPGKFTGRDRPFYHGRGPNDASGQWVASFPRNSHGYPRPKNVNQDIDYNPRGVNKAFNTRPSLSDRNEFYGGSHRGPPPPARGISRDRNRDGFRRTPQEEYNDPEQFYSERKNLSFSSNHNRGAHISQSRRRSRSRSRSGSPIAWHFQKKRNVDTRKQSPDYRSDTRVEASRSYNDRNITNGHYKDRRPSPVRTFSQSQRFDPPGYPGRLISHDNFRPTSRPARFPLANNNNDSMMHDDKYGMMNERRRFRYDVNDSFKARYTRDKDNGFRYTRNENRYFKDSESTSEEKGCRYTTNKMFNTGEGDFRNDNLLKE